MTLSFHFSLGLDKDVHIVIVCLNFTETKWQVTWCKRESNSVVFGDARGLGGEGFGETLAVDSTWLSN